MTDQIISMEGLVERLRQLAMNHAECGSAWSEDTDEWKAADAIEALLAKQAESDKRIGELEVETLWRVRDALIETGIQIGTSKWGDEIEIDAEKLAEAAISALTTPTKREMYNAVGRV